MTARISLAEILLAAGLACLPASGHAQQGLGAAPPATYPMPKTPNTYTTPQLAAGMDSQAGTPGRTLGIDAICGDCRLEKFTDECVGRLEGPNFDRDGNLWMVSPATSSIYKVTPDGHCAVVAQTPAPNGTRFSRDGKLYGVDNQRGVFWLDTKSLQITWVTNKFGAESFHGVDDLYFDREGGLYLTDAYGSSALLPQGQVFYLAPDGKVRKVIAGNLAFPNGVVLSPDEKTLYINDYDTNRIIAVQVTAPGELNLQSSWVFAYLNGGRGPDSMIIDSQGNVYAAHYGAGEVVVFDPHGFYFGAIRMPPGAGMVPSNMAFHDGYLYITEMDQHTVWRVKTKIPGVNQWPNG
jgi:gluconolactonase